MDEEECFWLLNYLAEQVAIEYYSDNMPGVDADLNVLKELVQQHAATTAQHMKKLECDMSLNCFKWLPSLGVGCFPTEVKFT